MVWDGAGVLIRGCLLISLLPSQNTTNRGRKREKENEECRVACAYKRNEGTLHERRGKGEEEQRSIYTKRKPVRKEKLENVRGYAERNKKKEDGLNRVRGRRCDGVRMEKKR